MGSACMCYRTTWLSIVYEGWPRRPQNRRHLPGEVVHHPEVTRKIIDNWIIDIVAAPVLCGYNLFGSRVDTIYPGPLWIRFIQLRQRQKSELRPRIAQHLSGRVWTPASATSISDNLADCKRVILLIINMLRRNLPARSYEKTYHLAGVEIA